MSIRDMLRGAAFSEKSDVAFGTTNGIKIYPWYGGIGTQYANAPDHPTGLVSAGLGWAPSGRAIGYGSTTAPYIFFYKWSEAGFGTRYTNPGGIPNHYVYHASWSADNSVVFMSHAISPFISAFEWTDEGGFGTRYADPTVLPSAASACLRWSPDGKYLAMVLNIGCEVYEWSKVSGWGAKVGSLTYSANSVTEVAWHPSGKYIAFSGNESPYLHVYNWSAAGFGSKVADPSALLPTVQLQGLAWSPQGDAIVGCSPANTPYLFAYAWDNGFGARYADPSPVTNAGGYGCAFSKDGTVIFGGGVSAFKWSASGGFGDKYTTNTPAAYCIQHSNPR